MLSMCSSDFPASRRSITSALRRAPALAAGEKLGPPGNRTRWTGVLSVVLELRNVSKRFSGIAAVDNVSFTARAALAAGEKLGLK